MRAVDTNVLVRLIVRDDEHQAATAERFIGQGAWISLVVLAEAIWVLDAIYERTARDIARALEMLLDHAQLAIQDEDVVKAALDAFRTTPRVGFTDHLVLAIARRAGHVPLGTLDKALGALDDAERLIARR